MAGWLAPGPRPSWAPPPFKMPWAVPQQPFPVSQNVLTGQPSPMGPPTLGPVNPAAAGQPFTTIPVPVPVPVPVPSKRQGKQSAPQGGLSPAEVFGMMGKGLTAPFDALADYSLSPQRANEPRISYGSRQVLTSPVKASVAAGNQMVGGAKAVGSELANAFRYLTATPDSDLKNAFAAMIMQESGGKQSAVSNKGAVGVAQVMPGTGPEAAKLAGLPWDPKRYRTDPAYNAAIGFAYFKEKVRENNGDVFKGMAAYNAGQGRVQQAERQAAQTGGNWTAFLPTETQQYVPSVLAKMGQMASAFGAPPPAFNSKPYLDAMAAQDAAAQMLKTPISAELNYAPLPERPKPAEFQAPDFTAGNAAFELTRPQNPFDDPKEAVRVQRQQYFKGIGQAMASLSGGEGIGTMLMKMGAGALMGRARGQELVDAKEEEYQRAMQQFNMALAQRNDSQAATAANILNQNISQRNQFNEALWQDNVQEIQKFQPQVQGDKLITYTPDANDKNRKVMTITPLGLGLEAEAILNKANIGLQMGQAQAAAGNFAYQHQQSTARTALGMAVQMSAQTGNGQAAAEGYLTETANRVRSTVQSGTWRQLLGNDVDNLAARYDQVAKQRAYGQLGIEVRENGQPVMPLEGQGLRAFQEAYENSLTAMLYEDIHMTGNARKLFSNPTAESAYQTRRAANTTSRQSVNAKGQSSYSTSWDME